MCEPFKCQFEYEDNRYDIQLSDSLPEVMFELIFDKIQRIIQLIANTNISFDSHVFQLFSDSQKTFVKIVNFNQLIRNESLLRVSVKSHSNNVNSNDRQNKETDETNGRNAIQISNTNTSNECNNQLNDISVEKTGLNRNQKTDANNASKSCELIQLFSQIRNNPYSDLYYKIYLYLSEIKTFSQNNCDLLTDFEWNYVIHKQMNSKAFAINDSKEWKTFYRYLCEQYIKALKGNNTYSGAKTVFPFFNEFNSLYFNQTNALYKDLMESRLNFLKAFEKNWSKEVKERPNDPTVEPLDKRKNLQKTIENQKTDELIREKECEFQSRLETSIEDIKGFYLLIQAIGSLSLDATDTGFLIKTTKRLSEYGLVWNRFKCERVLEKWLHFYDKNMDSYRSSLKANNRIVKYIYEFLNILQTVDLKNILYFETQIGYKKFSTNGEQVLLKLLISVYKKCHKFYKNDIQLIKMFYELNTKTNPELLKNFTTFLTEIKVYSENNCDLITDFEWNYIIHNQMVPKYFAIKDTKEWKIFYSYLCEQYLKALDSNNTYSGAETVFAFFEEFNSLYFNQTTALYKDLMESRLKFLKAFQTKCFDEINRNPNDKRIDPYMKNKEKVLRQTIEYQKKEELMRKKYYELQNELEVNIEYIKGFNLMIQTIDKLNIESNSRLFAEKMAKIMAENGLDWTESKCLSVIKSWILFYDKNSSSYENAVNSGNRIVEYIYGFLNIITTVELKNTLSSSYTEYDAYCRIRRKTKFGKIQNKLIMSLKDKETDKYYEKNIPTVRAIANTSVREPIGWKKSKWTVSSINNSSESGSDICHRMTVESNISFSAEDKPLITKFLDLIKNYSKNNCDLITEYEWINVIQQGMGGVGYRNSSEPNSWRKCYYKLIDNYIKTLQNSNTFEEANHSFPFFRQFNEIYFNVINPKYTRIMSKRKELQTKCKQLNISSGADIPLIETMIRQANDEQLSDGLQTELQKSIQEIKCLNLLIQIIDGLQSVHNRTQLYDKASTLLNQNGIKWSSSECARVLEKWIQFYNKNSTNIVNAIENDNRIVAYINEYLLPIMTAKQMKSHLLRCYPRKTATHKSIESLAHMRIASSPSLKSDSHRSSAPGQTAQTEVQTVKLKSNGGPGYECNQNNKRVNNFETSESNPTNRSQSMERTGTKRFRLKR